MRFDMQTAYDESQCRKAVYSCVSLTSKKKCLCRTVPDIRRNLALSRYRAEDVENGRKPGYLMATEGEPWDVKEMA
jgi:hypothetical protein